jgi:hypothetical protein
LAALLALPLEALPQVDIARMNLLCVQGLPSSEGLDAAHCLAGTQVFSIHLA